MEHQDRSGIQIPNSGQVRVAICGALPTAREHLLRCGVVWIDQYHDATEIPHNALYHLILVYAPQGEGLLNTVYNRGNQDAAAVPIRLLNEPACSSALIELKSAVRRIATQLDGIETVGTAFPAC